MVISNYSLQVIEQQFQDRFNLSLQEKLSDVFPEFYGGEKGLAIIRKKRLECNAWRILTGQGMFILMSLEPLFHIDLNGMAEWTNYLSEYDGNGDEAIESFFQLMKYLKKS